MTAILANKDFILGLLVGALCALGIPKLIKVAPKMVRQSRLEALDITKKKIGRIEKEMEEAGGNATASMLDRLRELHAFKEELEEKLEFDMMSDEEFEKAVKERGLFVDTEQLRAYEDELKQERAS